MLLNIRPYTLVNIGNSIDECADSRKGGRLKGKDSVFHFIAGSVVKSRMNFWAD